MKDLKPGRSIWFPFQKNPPASSVGDVGQGGQVEVGQPGQRRVQASNEIGFRSSWGGQCVWQGEGGVKGDLGSDVGTTNY